MDYFFKNLMQTCRLLLKPGSVMTQSELTELLQQIKQLHVPGVTNKVLHTVNTQQNVHRLNEYSADHLYSREILQKNNTHHHVWHLAATTCSLTVHWTSEPGRHHAVTCCSWIHISTNAECESIVSTSRTSATLHCELLPDFYRLLPTNICPVFTRYDSDVIDLWRWSSHLYWEEITNGS